MSDAQGQTDEPYYFSGWSTPAVDDSAWCASDFLLSAGMVLLHPWTNKLVVIHDPKTKSWSLPRGPRHVGDSLQSTALRVAYEEVGVSHICILTHTDTIADTIDSKLYASL